MPSRTGPLLVLAALGTLASCGGSDGPTNPVVDPPIDSPADTVGERIAELTARWNALSPDYVGTPYSSTPNWMSAPYDAGALAPEFQADGLELLNFLRFTAGLPGTLVVDATLRMEAQHASTLLARLQMLTRNPTKPADMDDAFFALADAGVNKSNLASGTELESLEHAIALWMDGNALNDELNRRWLLSPRMARTAFGFVNGYAAAQVLDNSRTPALDYDFIAWPAPLATPLEFFEPDHYWTLSLSTDWSIPDANAVTVTVTRLADNQSWALTTADDGGDEYLAVATINAGTGPSLVFRPGTGFTAEADDRYLVEVDGLERVGVGPTPLAYAVSFFMLGS